MSGARVAAPDAAGCTGSGDGAAENTASGISSGPGNAAAGTGVSGARVDTPGAAGCTGSGDGAAGAWVFSAVDAERCAGMP
ncbi:MAG TPA: hypothetical protein VFM01_11710, partial [Nakamurella sp.]|nr:hypothetical protein [Nakamurella sp.]